MEQALKLAWPAFIEEFQYAATRVPFYRKQVEALGLNCSDIQQLEDLDKIPVTGKQDYRKHFPAGVLADGYSFSDSSLYRSQSSGTMGERLITLEQGMLLLDRAYKAAAVNLPILQAFIASDKRICRYAAPNCSDVECANPNSQLQDRLLHDGTLVLPVYHDLLTTSETLINRAIDEIYTYKPTLYYVDPTHFAFLLRAFRAKGLKPHKAPVLTTYSAMTRISRRRIEEAMGSMPVQLAAMSEMGWLGVECSHGRLHLNSQAFFMEIRDRGRLVRPGERGELVVSSLDKGAVPHLRYCSGDIYQLDPEPCPCGNPTPTARLEGRLSHFLVKDGIPTISPQDVDAVIGAPDWLEQYQFHQMSERGFVLKIIVREGETLNLVPVQNGLEELLGGDVKITIETLNYIASERSGKFQSVKSDVEATTDHWQAFKKENQHE